MNSAQHLLTFLGSGTAAALCVYAAFRTSSQRGVFFTLLTWILFAMAGWDISIAVEHMMKVIYA